MQSAKVFMEDFKFKSNTKYLIVNMLVDSDEGAIKYDANITVLVDFFAVSVSNLQHV